MALKRVAFVLLAGACLAAAVVLFRPGFREAFVKPETHTETLPAKPSLPSAPSVQETAPAAASGETVTAAEWNTYHGNSDLTGVAEASFPDVLETAWQVTAGGPVEQAPVVSSGRIFAATSKGRLLALELDGKEVWRCEIAPETPPGQTPAPFHVEAPLACFDNRVFVGTDDGKLTAIHAETGQKVWQIQIEGFIHGTPIYHKDSGSLIVLEQETGVLTALDPSTGARRWQTEGVDRADGSPAVTGALAVYGSCASALHVISATDGSKLRDIKIEAGGGQIAGGAALADGFAYAGCRDGRVVQADLEAGTLTWIQPVSESEVFSTPAVRGDRVIVTSLDGRIHALDHKTGVLQWQHELGGEPGSPIIAGDKIIVTSDDKIFLVKVADGTRIWEMQLPGFISTPAVAPGLIVFGCEDGTITALRPAT